MSRRTSRAARLTLAGSLASALVVGCSDGGSGSAGGPAPLPGQPVPTRSAGGSGSASALPSERPRPSNTNAACGAVAPPLPEKQQHRTAPPPLRGLRTVTLTTSCGAITMELFGDKAPQAVGSFLFLTREGYFDGSPCHRLTTSPALRLLQCGDPTGTGKGGPGYEFADENLAGATYPRGTVAMANDGPNSNGSQFFLMIADSRLPPSYTPFGRVYDAGLTVLDRVLALGVKGGKTDGPPALPVYLETVEVLGS